MPFGATLDHPCQDSGPFGFELGIEIEIALGRRDGDGERDKMESAAHGLIDASQARLMIAGDDELELRDVLEEVLPHEPRCNPVASGKRLDLAFRPSPPLLGFDSGYETSAAQVRPDR